MDASSFLTTLPFMLHCSKEDFSNFFEKHFVFKCILSNAKCLFQITDKPIPLHIIDKHCHQSTDNTNFNSTGKSQYSDSIISTDLSLNVYIALLNDSCFQTMKLHFDPNFINIPTLFFYIQSNWYIVNHLNIETISCPKPSSTIINNNNNNTHSHTNNTNTNITPNSNNNNNNNILNKQNTNISSVILTFISQSNFNFPSIKMKWWIPQPPTGMSSSSKISPTLNETHYNSSKIMNNNRTTSFTTTTTTTTTTSSTSSSSTTTATTSYDIIRKLLIDAVTMINQIMQPMHPWYLSNLILPSLSLSSSLTVTSPSTSSVYRLSTHSITNNSNTTANNGNNNSKQQLKSNNSLCNTLLSFRLSLSSHSHKNTAMNTKNNNTNNTNATNNNCSNNNNNTSNTNNDTNNSNANNNATTHNNTNTNTNDTNTNTIDVSQSDSASTTNTNTSYTHEDCQIRKHLKASTHLVQLLNELLFNIDTYIADESINNNFSQHFFNIPITTNNNNDHNNYSNNNNASSANNTSSGFSVYDYDISTKLKQSLFQSIPNTNTNTNNSVTKTSLFSSTTTTNITSKTTATDAINTTNKYLYNENGKPFVPYQFPADLCNNLNYNSNNNTNDNNNTNANSNLRNTNANMTSSINNINNSKVKVNTTSATNIDQEVSRTVHFNINTHSSVSTSNNNNTSNQYDNNTSNTDNNINTTSTANSNIKKRSRDNEDDKEKYNSNFDTNTSTNNIKNNAASVLNNDKAIKTTTATSTSATNTTLSHIKELVNTKHNNNNNTYLYNSIKNEYTKSLISSNEQKLLEYHYRSILSTQENHIKNIIDKFYDTTTIGVTTTAMTTNNTKKPFTTLLSPETVGKPFSIKTTAGAGVSVTSATTNITNVTSLSKEVS